MPSPIAAPDSPQRADHPTPAGTARDFEAVFLSQIAQIMMETVDAGPFSGGHAETMMRSIMAEQIGREMARRGGIGIAPLVLDQIIDLQGSSAKGEAK
ncbi:MAG: hypothetical protein RIS17_856 [Pseudomonadota bacterium]|jgi:Rod binding domain-containing protein